MHRVLISAAHKSSGKTTISIGLCAALKQRGLIVQPYKKGPDYIDPMWLTQASGRACRNLDLYLMSRDDVLDTFQRHAQNADICIVEGNKGLYDGLALDGSNSNAALAKMLDLPVVLVLDARGMTRGIAPLILGYQAFDRDINIVGVILNNLGGSRHEGKLRAVIEHYTDVPVIGAVHNDERLQIKERHLGLMPSNESAEAANFIHDIGEVIAQQVDLDKLLAVTSKTKLNTPPLPCHREGEAVVVEPLKRQQPRTMERAGERVETSDPLQTSTPSLTLPLQGGGDKRIRIGIARDQAFGFYYADDLDALQAAGAELVSFDTLHDAHLPDVDALYIGGGFPEMFAQELAANSSLRNEIKSAIEADMPVYAECGGLMYLSRSLTFHGQRHDMVGVIPGDVVMHDKPIGRGYVHLAENSEHPWPRPPLPSPPRGGGAGGEEAIEKFPSPQSSDETTSHSTKPAGGQVAGYPASGRGGERKNQPLIFAHEFHYSSLENLPADSRYAYRVTRGHGIDGQHDGLIYKNLLASYTHLRTIGSCYWASRFVAFARSVKQYKMQQQLAAPEDNTPTIRL